MRIDYDRMTEIMKDIGLRRPTTGYSEADLAFRRKVEGEFAAFRKGRPGAVLSIPVGIEGLP